MELFLRFLFSVDNIWTDLSRYSEDCLLLQNFARINVSLYGYEWSRTHFYYRLMKMNKN